jgi:hypothetical protein
VQLRIGFILRKIKWRRKPGMLWLPLCEPNTDRSLSVQRGPGPCRFLWSLIRCLDAWHTTPRSMPTAFNKSSTNFSKFYTMISSYGPNHPRLSPEKVLWRSKVYHGSFAVSTRACSAAISAELCRVNSPVSSPHRSSHGPPHNPVLATAHRAPTPVVVRYLLPGVRIQSHTPARGARVGS